MSEITHSYGKCEIDTRTKESLRKLILLMNIRYFSTEYGIKIVELSNLGFYSKLPNYPIVDKFARDYYDIDSGKLIFDIEGQARYTFDDNVKLLLPEILEYDYENEQLNTYRDELLNENINIKINVEEVRFVDGLSWRTEYKISAYNKKYTYEILEK